MILIPFVSRGNSKRLRESRAGGGGGGGGGGSSSGGGGRGGSSGAAGGTSSGRPSSNGNGGVTGGTSGSNTSGNTGGGRGGSNSGGSSTNNGGGTRGNSNTGSTGNGGKFSPPAPANRGTPSITTIGSGQLFSGRTQGGGTRDQIYGTKYYGSGYPGVTGRGVNGRGFPFFYWPIAWGGVGVVTGAGAYLYTQEYGLPDNSSRPSGPLHTASIPSSSSNTTFHLLSDENAINVLTHNIVSTCGNQIRNTSQVVSIAYNLAGPPFPEQAVQYYRASSVVLTLDGYNNTAVFNNNENTPDIPLPNNIDTNLLDCLNITIANRVPLVGGAQDQNNGGLPLVSPWSSSLGLIILAYMLIPRLIF